ARAHQVTLIASSFAGEMQTRDAVRLATRAATRVGKYVQFLDALDKHLARAQYDVVHAMLPVRRCDVYHPHAGIAADAIASGHLKHAAAMKRALGKVANRINIKRRSFAATEHELLNGAGPPIELCRSNYVKGA